MSGRWGSVLARHGIRPGRRLGQHFLFDGGILDRIAAASGAGPGDVVLEVGPGVGSLTRALLARGAAVFAVERDRTLGPALVDALSDMDAAAGEAAPAWPSAAAGDAVLDIGGRVRVLWGDAVRLPWDQLADGPERWRICSNLPYYLTGPFLAEWLVGQIPWEVAVLLVQAESAARMTARPGTPAYGAFTCLVQYHAEVERLFSVPRGAFVPPPDVESAVVRLRPRSEPPTSAPRAALFQVVRAAFGQRRKNLLNALSAGLPCARADILAALTRCGLPPERRGETLSLEEFGALTQVLLTVGLPG